MIANETGLLFSLSSWFRISSVIVCQQLSDSSFAQMEHLSNRYGKQMSIHFSDGVPRHLPQIIEAHVRKETHTTVICDDPEFEKSMHKDGRASGGERVVWGASR